MKAPHPQSVLRATAELELSVTLKTDGGNIEISGGALIEPGSGSTWSDLLYKAQFVTASLLDAVAANLTDEQLDTLFSTRIK